jgi:hypothetical protein
MNGARRVFVIFNAQILHLGQQSLLKVDLIGRLGAGKLQAFGIEEGSNAGPIPIAQYYLTKNAKVDWEKDIITAAGKIFHEVRLKWEREPVEEGRPLKPTRWVHQRELEQLALGPSTDLEGFIDPSEQWEQESLDEALSNEPPSSGEPSEFMVQSERELTRYKPRSEPTPSLKRMGRPLLVPKVRRVVRELIDQGKLDGKLIKEVTELVRAEAQERFRRDFFGPGRPSKPTIIAALEAEGWYSSDDK